MEARTPEHIVARNNCIDRLLESQVHQPYDLCENGTQRCKRENYRQNETT